MCPALLVLAATAVMPAGVDDRLDPRVSALVEGVSEERLAATLDLLPADTESFLVFACQDQL